MMFRLILTLSLFCFFDKQHAASHTLIQHRNIASFNPNSSHVIQFCMTREPPLGALKYSLLQELKKGFSIQVFIETGTFLGYTTLAAAKIFDKVHTIELSKEIYLMAQENLKNCKNVSVHQGNSCELLNNLLPSIPACTLFYLDGHYSGGSTAKGSQNTPVLEELAAIRNSGKSDSIILIDDICAFQDSCYPEKISNTCLEGYPDLNQLVNALLEINPGYQICFLADTLLAFPENSLVAVSPVVNACTLHRLENFIEGLSEEALQGADSIIARAKGKEKEEFSIYFNLYRSVEEELGYRCFAALWYALILREHGQEQLAFSILQSAAEHSMPHWRVEHFLR